MRKRVYAGSLLALMMTTLFSCNNTEERTKAIRPIKTTKVERSDKYAEPVMVPATINELKETKLSFRVGGPLVMLNDVTGSYVEKGEAIAKIDQRDFKVGLVAVEAQYKFAKSEYERYQALLAKQSVAKSVFDRIESAYKGASTGFNKATNALNDTELKAPFSGYINNVFVNNYEKVGPNMPIVSLLDLSKLEVKAFVSYELATSIDDNTSYTCVVSRNGKKTRIPAIFKELGTKTSRTKQSFPITVLIDSSEDMALRSGMSATLEIRTEKNKSDLSIQVPINSIYSKNQKSYVWIFNKAKEIVRAKEIEIGTIKNGEMIEVTKGLKGGEEIATTGVHFLHEGQKVKKFEPASITNVGNKL